MDYTTVAMIRRDTGFADETKISDATIEEAIAEATTTINGYVSVAYVLPFAGSTAPATIQTIATELAIVLLYINEYGEESQNTDKDWERRLNKVMDDLEAIRDHKLLILDENDVEYATTDTGSMSFYPTAASTAVGQPDYPRVTMSKRF